MGFTDFLKEVGSAARFIPVVGSYVSMSTDEEDFEDTRTQRGAVTALERTLHGLTWAYDNGVSQPLATGMLQGHRDDLSAVFSADEWAKAWHAAENISPGQAFFMRDPVRSPLLSAAGINPGDTARDEAQTAINAKPYYYEPEDLSRMEGWDELTAKQKQDFLKKQGMPVVGNAYIESLRRDSDFFKYASGTLDFAARWYLDPLVVGGRVAGAARRKYAVNPRPRGGWSESEIAELVDSSKMAKTREFLWANKDDPALLNNLSMARKSALGPRFGPIVAQMKSPGEVDLFLRSAMGDVRARGALEQTNKAAANRIQKDTARLSELDMRASSLADHANPRAKQMVDARIAELHQQINADTSLVTRYSDALKHTGELDALNVTRFSAGRAQRRTKAERDYRIGPARKGALQRSTSGSREALGFTKIPSDFLGTPLTLLRTFKEANPNGLMAVDDITRDSVAELRGHVARIPGIGPEIRHDILNRYLATADEGARLEILDEVGKLGATKIAEKHGFTADEGIALFREHSRRVGIEQKALADRRFSGAQHPEEGVFVDEFMTEGGKLSLHPNMATKLANSHVMQDLTALDTTLARHGSALKSLRVPGGTAADLVKDGAEFLNRLWKFGVLFRLGYIPRVLGDDIAGQVARLGASEMALRTGWGIKNLATNLAQRKPASFHEAREATLREGVKWADEELATLRPELIHHQREVGLRREVAQRSLTRARDRHRRARNNLNALDPETAAARTVRTRQKLVEKRAAEVRREEGLLARVGGGKQERMAHLEEQVLHLDSGRANAVKEMEAAALAKGRGYRQSSQLYREPEVAPGVKLPAALSGDAGEYFGKQISSDDSLRNIFATNKRMVHNNLVRAYGQSGRSVSYPQNPEVFVQAWDKAVNHQIMQDALARQAVKGASIQDMSKWLTNTAEGRAYRKRLGIKYDTTDRIAASVYHEVDQYLPTQLLRETAARGEASPQVLKEAAERGEHPFQVHSTDLSETLSGQGMRGAMDRIMDRWFKTVASLPADRMSRHPLFNRMYEGHAKTIAAQEIQQGARVTVADAERIAQTARRLALRDTRGLVFDIAHRSDAGAALRFASPFFSATTEAWQRWARIIADKPQTVGYAGMFFNAPTSLGWMQDRDGNKIFRDGTALDPVTGERYTVPKGDRIIMARVPKSIARGPIGKALGMSEDGKLAISQDSMNIVTQGDPWFNPGTGPMVSIPVNELVRDKPEAAEVARHLGVLPFGPETSTLFGDNPLGRAAAMSAPSAVKNFLTAFDTSDHRYQQVKLHIMQKAAFEHENEGKPMPSAKEISAMTRDYWLKSAAWSFVQPAATQRPDKYEFYRQQYRKLRRADWQSADQEFIDRFGSDYFYFAQSSGDSSLPPTKSGVKSFKANREMIAKNPELADLIIGPEGKGPFSPEAYAYSLTTPLEPGDSVMATRKLSASEAMKENEKRLAWARFSKAMHGVTASLHKAGFASFSDKGAEQFKVQKQAIVALLGEMPELPDGSKNEFYSEEWSKDYFTLDSKKYDRLIPDLQEIAFSPLAKNENRTDLRQLQKYLLGREAVRQLLAAQKAKGGASTLEAKANAGLARNWALFVDDLIEKDTRFGDLYYRYLSRDLGVSVDELKEVA